MRRFLPLPALALMLPACGGGQAPQKAPEAVLPGPGEAQLVKPERTYTVKLPDNWTRLQGDGFESLVDPDKEVKFHIRETTGDELAKVAAETIEKIAPKMALKERQRIDSDKGEHFSEQLVITYTDDSNTQIAQAVIMRHGTKPERVYALFIEGPLKGVMKRQAEITRIVTSMEVEGIVKATVAPDHLKPFDAERRAAFFAFVEKARQMSGVPGVSVAVVTPEGVFTKGFGHKTTDGEEAITASTQFMIGSVTKSFSTMLLATLVDAEQLKWEQPVKEVSPEFELGDARGAALQLQHLFCACVGAPRQDMEILFQFEGKKPEDAFAEVAEMKLTTALGETFQYNNQLTAVGGYIAGDVAAQMQPKVAAVGVGEAYAQALKGRVLKPMGMDHSTLDPEAVVARGDFATPHRLSWTGETQPVDMKMERFVLPYAPAGALWSTADDMARYLQVQLKRGETPEGHRVVSEANLGRTQTPQVPVSDDAGYGMGWLTGKYKGLVGIGHSGATMGFNSDLTFFPEIGVGLFVVGNRSPSAMNGAVKARLFELLFDLPPKIEEKLEESLTIMGKLQKEQAKKVTDAPVPEALLGRYTNDRLGPLVLTKEGEGVKLDAGEWQGGLGVFDPEARADTLIITSGVMEGVTLQHGTADGKPTLLLKHSQSDYLFTHE